MLPKRHCRCALPADDVMPLLDAPARVDAERAEPRRQKRRIMRALCLMPARRKQIIYDTQRCKEAPNDDVRRQHRHERARSRRRSTNHAARDADGARRAARRSAVTRRAMREMRRAVMPLRCAKSVMRYRRLRQRAHYCCLAGHARCRCCAANAALFRCARRQMFYRCARARVYMPARERPMPPAEMTRRVML